MESSCRTRDALFRAGTIADETVLWVSAAAVVAGWC